MPAKAVLGALRHVWTTLEPLKLPMAVIGGIGLATWKHVRATRDVDLLLGIGMHDPGDVIQRLRAAGIRPKRDPPAVSVGQLDVVQCLYEPPETFVDLQIDVLMARSGYSLQAVERRVPARLPDLDVEVAVLACEDLILHKLLAGRILDRADAAALLRANRESLDRGYLAHWTRALKLTDEFTEVWNAAIPEESAPAGEDPP
jgi:hypothetical protein